MAVRLVLRLPALDVLLAASTVLPLGQAVLAVVSPSAAAAVAAHPVLARVVAVLMGFDAVLVFRAARAKATGPRRWLGRAVALALAATASAWLVAPLGLDEGPALRSPVASVILAAACAGVACFAYATSPARR